MPSLVIAKSTYDKEHSRLTIVFTTGRVYEYSMVPPSVIADFSAARSQGAFFNRNIRDKYPCREIAGEKIDAPPVDLMDQLKRSAE